MITKDEKAEEAGRRQIQQKQEMESDRSGEN